jgi:c-di-GMP-binding flagellar brake protein YcgR
VIRGPAGRDTRKNQRVALELAVLVSDAAKKVRKPIRFSTTDVSCGGTFLRADVLFEVGEVLLIEFDLPGGRHIRTQSRVVRVARGGQKDKFPGMGLEFLDLSTDDRAAIHARIS